MIKRLVEKKKNTLNILIVGKNPRERFLLINFFLSMLEHSSNNNDYKDKKIVEVIGIEEAIREISSSHFDIVVFSSNTTEEERFKINKRLGEEKLKNVTFVSF